MAEFGANHPCFKRDDADAGVVLGKLVSANLTVNLASGELYADDSLAEQLSEFSSGSIAMETDDLSDANIEEVYGASVSDGVVTYNKNDTCPRGSLAYYKVLMRNGVKYFKACFYPRVRAALGNDNAQTKGNSITFTPVSTAFTVMADDNGDWRETKIFNDAASAAAWCETKTGVAAHYAVEITAQNLGAGKAVSPLGTVYAAAGENVVINITGTPSALYDNGTEKKSSIASNKYTISTIAADHSVAVIF